MSEATIGPVPLHFHARCPYCAATNVHYPTTAGVLPTDRATTGDHWPVRCPDCGGIFRLFFAVVERPAIALFTPEQLLETHAAARINKHKQVLAAKTGDPLGAIKLACPGCQRWFAGGLGLKTGMCTVCSQEAARVAAPRRRRRTS